MKPEMSHVKKVKAGASRGKEEIPKKRGRGRPVGSKNNIKWIKGFPAYSRFPFCVKKERTQGGESSSCRIERPLQNGIKHPAASGEVIVCIKRGRGRPRKIETEMKREEVQKRRRGRPKKILTVPKDEHPNILLGKKNVGFRPKMRKQNYYASECEASTSNAGSHQVTHEIHPPGVSAQRGWTRESAMSDELLPPGREPLGPQYPGWETGPSHVNWVPGGVADPSGNSTVTHWFVEEPHVPRAAQYPEGPSVDHEFREDLLQGLADFRYQITRELAAARGEMRDGAELVRSAIDGVAAEIHRLGLLLQPLITALNSGSMLYPTQNSPSLNPLLRHQQDTPPDDPPSVSNQANLTGIPPQDAFSTRSMSSSQCDSLSRNTQCPCRPTSTLTISPSPQEEELCSQPQEDPPKDSIPLIECPPATKKLYLRKEKCRGSSTDLPRHDLNAQAQGDPQKHCSSMSERPVSIKRICQRKERCNGSTDDVAQEIASPTKSASTLKQDKSPSQFSSIDEDGKTIMVDYPSVGKLSDSKEKNPALSDDPVKVPMSPLLDYTLSESPDSLMIPLSWSPPSLQAGATEAPLLDVSPAEHLDTVSGMSPMPLDSSVPT